MTVLLDQVSRSGVRTTLFKPPGERRRMLRMSQDCAPILEDNRQAARAYQPQMQHNRIGARRIASIPFVVWAQLEQLGIVKGTRIIDERALFKLLSDPELRFLRTDNGKRLA